MQHGPRESPASAPPSQTSAAGFAEPRFDMSSKIAPREDINFGVIESLQGAFMVWKESLPRVLLPGAIYMCCFFVVGAVVGLASVGMVAFAKDAAPNWQSPTVWGPLVGLGIGGFVFAVALFSSAYGATMVILDEVGRAVGAPSDITAMMRRVPRMAWRVAAATFTMMAPLLVGVSAAGGLVVALAQQNGLTEADTILGMSSLATIIVAIPASIVMLRLAPLPAIVVLEEKGLRASAARSWQLTRGRTGTLFGAYFVFGLSVFGAMLGSMLLAMIPLVGMVVQMVAGAGAFSFSIAFAYAIYVGLVHEHDGKHT